MRPNIDFRKFIGSFDEFIQQVQQLDKADNPKLVFKEVIRWTKGQPLLTKKLLQYIIQSQQKISAGNEIIAVEKIVRKRLIKEFEKDKLTLAIRKLCYQKDFATIYQKNKGAVEPQAERYLQKSQLELGLSTQQCKIITEQYIESNFRYRTSDFSEKNNRTKNNNKSNQDQFKQQRNSKGLFLSPKSWFLLLIPLILITIITNWQREFEFIKTVASSHKKNVCVDLNSRQSPRMSLGEKLLAQDYQNVHSQSMVTLYEGVASFARCEYSTASEKFQASLNLNKNNPEALIYLNNAKAISQEHFKIAVSVPLGSIPEVAHEILRGVAQAQAEINQQNGIRQKLLLVQIVNDNNDPVIVRQVAQQLAEDSSVIAVVGHNTSNASLAGSEVYQKAGLVMVSPTSGSTELSGIGSYIMRTTPSVAIMANTLADYASVNYFKNIVVCADSRSSASSSFVEEFILEMNNDGGKVAGVKCDFAQKNLDPHSIVKQAISQNADALLLAPSLDRLNQAIAIAQANQQRLPLLGSHSLYTFEIIKQGKEHVAGMVLPSPWIPPAASDHDFSQSMIKYWGGAVNWRTATAYDATQAIIQGLKSSRTRSKLQSVITQSDFVVNGVTGKFRFDRGDRLGQTLLVYITESDTNSQQYQFAPLDLNIKQK